MFLLAFILFSSNILKVNLCIHIHIYIKKFIFFSLAPSKREENESDSWQSYEWYKPSHLFCLHFIGLGLFFQIIKHKFYWYLYKSVSCFYYNYMSNVYNLYIIQGYAKIILKLALTLSCKKIVKF
jgi:hypothetical protein